MKVSESKAKLKVTNNKIAIFIKYFFEKYKI
jgi:hypothetical protein